LLPATGTPEPGGLFWGDALMLLERVFASRRVVGCDLVELAPLAGFHAGDFLAAKLGAPHQMRFGAYALYGDKTASR